MFSKSTLPHFLILGWPLARILITAVRYGLTIFLTFDTATTRHPLSDDTNRVHTAFNMHGSRQYYPVHPAKGYTIDLLFAPENCVVNLLCDDPLVSSDGHHMAQYFPIAVPTNYSVDNSVPLKRDFYGCDYAFLNEHLDEVDWDTVLTEYDITRTFQLLIN